MRILLDSHVLLWFYCDEKRISAVARQTILDLTNIKLVSPASYWEIAIKVSLGKYRLLESFPDFVQHAIFDNGFQVLPIEPHHVANLINMKQIHKDPFDRLLISQAAVEDISLVSADAMFDGYPIKRIW